MEQEAVDYMLFLKQNASELRKLGSDWGMTDEEINGCIDEALSQVKSASKLKKSSTKNKARTIWSYILFMMKIPVYTILLVISLFLLVTIVSTVHEPTDKFISKVLQPLGYDIFRLIRIATLPIHRVANITSYYDAECMIDNPFFTDPVSDCYECVNVKSVKEVNSTDMGSRKLKNTIQMMKPILFKNSLEKPLTYQDVRQNYLDNQQVFDEGLHKFESTNPRIRSPQDLFVEDQSELLKTSGGMHIVWQSRKVLTSVALRKLFPRPAFLPDKIEISLEKHVMIDSPETPTYELPIITQEALVYTLASGHRRLLVKPVSQCVEKCQSLLVIMEPGDSLLVSEQVWRVYVAGKGEDAAVGYIMPVLS